MTFVEAVAEADSRFTTDPSDDVWIRPVAWKGIRQAICVATGALRSVPSARGGFAWIPLTRLVLADWEVVTPDIVLGGE